jgi:mRNA interferase RelE/StbE
VSYSVVIAHEAVKILDRLDRPTEQRIRTRIIQLAEDPFDPRLSAPLTERTGIRKSRVGGWRILITANQDTRTLFVLTLDPRGQVYNTSDDSDRLRQSLSQRPEVGREPDTPTV